MNPFDILPTDTKFSNSPDAGDPTCICSRCFLPINEARALVPQFRAIAEKLINKEEIESVKEMFGIDLEQEAHNLGIDLKDYAIIKAGNKVVLQHKTTVQRMYEIKSPAGFMKKQEEETQEKLRKAEEKYSYRLKYGMEPLHVEPESKKEPVPSAGSMEIKEEERRIRRELNLSYTLSGAEDDMVVKAIDSYMKMRDKSILDSILIPVRKGKLIANDIISMVEKKLPIPVSQPPPVAKPVQSIQEVKQQVLNSIQAARTVEELQPIQKGIGFLPLPEQEKRQVMNAYKNRYSMLMSEKPFGAPVKVEGEKPRVLGAPSPQERFEAEQRKKAVSAFRGQQKLTSGASVTRKLSEFGIKERMLPGMTSSMRAYIQGAQAVREVIHYFRDGSPPIRGVAYRARDRTYFVEAQDGQIYASIGWEEIKAQPQGVSESYGNKQKYKEGDEVEDYRGVKGRIMYLSPVLLPGVTYARILWEGGLFKQYTINEFERTVKGVVKKDTKPQGVRESYGYTQRQRFTIKQDGRVFANEDDPTEAENIYSMLKRTYPRSAIDLLENLVHPRVHQRVMKEYNPMFGETIVAGAGMVREPSRYAGGHARAAAVRG